MAIATAPKAIYLRCELKVGLWNGLTAPAQYSDPLNFTKIELTAPVQEKEELISNMTSTFGSALDSQGKPTESGTVEMDFNTMTPALLALVLGADLTEFTQQAGEVANEVVTTVLNVWVPLANSYIAPDVTGTPISLTTSDGTPVADSKFEIDHTLGMIKAIDAAAVGVGMKLTYWKAATTAEQYAAGMAKSAYVHLAGQATDMVTNKTGRLDIWRANLTPGGAVDPVAGGYFSGTLSGSLITPTGRASPWQWHALS